MKISVIIPHFRAQHWLAPCLTLLRARCSDHTNITYDVLWMDETPPPANRDNVRFHDYPVPGKIGGEPLPIALQYGMTLVPDAHITVTVDPDALVLADDWDLVLSSLLFHRGYVCAGINPRSDHGEFAGVPEWNWMAFRTDFWQQHVKTFQWNRCDIGHLFTDAAAKVGAKVFTWPLIERPFPGKLGGIVGDAESPRFAMHAFYSSRRRLDVIPNEEHKAILTPEQEQEFIGIALK